MTAPEVTVKVLSPYDADDWDLAKFLSHNPDKVIELGIPGHLNPNGEFVACAEYMLSFRPDKFKPKGESESYRHIKLIRHSKLNHWGRCTFGPFDLLKSDLDEATSLKIKPFADELGITTKSLCELLVKNSPYL